MTANAENFSIPNGKAGFRKAYHLHRKLMREYTEKMEKVPRRYAWNSTKRIDLEHGIGQEFRANEARLRAACPGRISLALTVTINGRVRGADRLEFIASIPQRERVLFLQGVADRNRRVAEWKRWRAV